MPSNMNRGPFFPAPGGDTTVEIPDGVTKTEGHYAPNSLLNAGWVCGGFDGHGYGAFKRDDDGIFSVPYGRSDERFRVR